MSPGAISVQAGNSECEVAQLLGGIPSTSALNNEIIAPEAQNILHKLAKGFSDNDIPGPQNSAKFG